MTRQRLRGILGTTIAISIPWTALGFAAGLVFQLDLVPSVHLGLGRPIPGGLITFGTLAGAVVGIVNGLLFSGVLVAMERGKRFEDLHGWRFATWSAIATAGTLGLLTQSFLGAGIGCVAGAASGLAVLQMARRVLARQSDVTSVTA